MMYVCLSLLLLVCCVSGEERKTYRKLLVFGGNGMMGSATVTRLLDDLWADVTIVNRGNWYWDSQELIKPRVTKHIMCDRSLPLTSCPVLMRELQFYFYHAVIDFSAYDPASLQAALSALNGRAGVYIYISSDSVYEVCADKDDDSRWSRESDALRPLNLTERERRAKADDYGDRKLRCEDLLVAQAPDDPGDDVGTGKGVPYVILRLPDVVGERDNTLRWWYYQLWLRFHKQLGQAVEVPEEIAARRMSLVYVDDVARLIVELIDSGSHLWNQAYNVALDEQVTLVDLLHIIQNKLGIPDEDVVLDVSKSHHRHLYPTVLRGPVDTGKVKLLTTWHPTPLAVVARNLVQFYERASVHFPRERGQVLWMMVTDLVDHDNEHKFYQLVDAYYRTDKDVAGDASSVREEL